MKYTEQDIIDINKRQYEIADKLGFIGTADCLTEELSELIQAICKYKRALGYGQPTPKSIGECKDNLIEEMADVKAGLLMLQHLLDIQDDEFIRWNNIKSHRGLERLANRDNEDKNSKVRANIMIKLINDPNKLLDKFKSIIEYAKEYGGARHLMNTDRDRLDEGVFEYKEDESSRYAIDIPYCIDKDLSEEDKYMVIILDRLLPIRISIKNETVSFDKWVVTTPPDRFFYVVTKFIIYYLDKIKDKEVG